MEIIAEQARVFLLKNRVDQWAGSDPPYPSGVDFLADMTRGECYVLTCGGEVGAFFTLSTQPEENYAAITDGKWSEDEPYATIHRCAVADKWRGSGLADRMVKECERLAPEQDIFWLRVDTHKKNKAMQGLLRRNGFQYRGNVLVDAPEGHDPRRVAYEKRLRGGKMP